MKKALALFFALVLGLVIFLSGLAVCSEDGRKALSSAGTNLLEAASDTGNAIHAGTTTAGATLTSDASSVGNAVFGVHNIGNATLVSNPIDKVHSGLMSHPELGISQLRVEVKDNVVTLIGKVPTEIQNQDAQKLARQLAGDPFRIDDRLAVSKQDSL